MKITSIAEQPVTRFSFLNAGKGSNSYYVDYLPIHVADVVGLPDELDAIVATADLQGRERFEAGNTGPPRLLGEVLPEWLHSEVLSPLEVLPQRTAVILAGDFYTVPGLDQRGGSGDVTAVWRAFAERFKWVVGVAGNHDTFGDHVAPSRRIARNTHYLDGTVAKVDGLSIAGIGGIVGNPRKPHRKTDDAFADLIGGLAEESPDIFVMHDGPESPRDKFRGSPRIRAAVEQTDISLIVRGHAHWPQPLAELGNGTQVLNVDCRVAILRRPH